VLVGVVDSGVIPPAGDVAGAAVIPPAVSGGRDVGGSGSPAGGDDAAAVSPACCSPAHRDPAPAPCTRRACRTSGAG
jgi:hypothetical protein